MTFEEHLANHRNADGSFDTAAAEADLAAEYAGDPQAVSDLAKKAASADRRRWESSNRGHLRKQWTARQGTLLDLDAMVPLGDNTVVTLGSMNQDRIQIRKDLVTKSHIDHLSAFTSEMEFWMHWRDLMDPTDTLSDIM